MWRSVLLLIVVSAPLRAFGDDLAARKEEVGRRLQQAAARVWLLEDELERAREEKARLQGQYQLLVELEMGLQAKPEKTATPGGRK